MNRELEDLLQAGYRYAMSLCADSSDAQDLVQESWARLLARSGQSIERRQLLRAIRNLYIDGYRHRRRFPTESLDAVEGRLPAGASRLEEPTDQALQEALLRLSDQERETLFLAVIEGWTAAEIAASTDRPRGTVLSTLHRCRRKLRGWLEREPDEVALGDGEGAVLGRSAHDGATVPLKVVNGRSGSRAP